MHGERHGAGAAVDDPEFSEEILRAVSASLAAA